MLAPILSIIPERRRDDRKPEYIRLALITAEILKRISPDITVYLPKKGALGTDYELELCTKTVEFGATITFSERRQLITLDRKIGKTTIHKQFTLNGTGISDLVYALTKKRVSKDLLRNPTS